MPIRLPDQGQPTEPSSSVQDRLRSLGNQLNNLYSNLPLGTVAIVVLSNLLFIINLFTPNTISNGLCVAATPIVNYFFIAIHRLVGYPLVHSGLYHQIISSLLFPLTAAKTERNVGTLKFLVLFCVLSWITSILYVIPVWFISFVDASWGTFCISGLDIPFMTFFTIEVLDYNPSNQIPPDNTPRIMYALACAAVMWIFTPFASILVKLSAIALGYTYYYHIFKFPAVPDDTLLALETSRVLSVAVQMPNYVALTNGGYSSHNTQLPGGYPEQPQNRNTFFSRFGNNEYNPIGDDESLLKEDHDQLWDDVDVEVISGEEKETTQSTP